MNKPNIADNKPKPAELEKGKDYFWCACGRSKNGQFCDGSHKGTSFTPKKFTAGETGTAYICMCKTTKSQPYCDGSHKSINSHS